MPRERLLARYGEAGIDRVRRMFEAKGLVYNPHPEIVPNTMKALRVTELARDRGLHQPVHDRLMVAYWAEARNIGDPANCNPSLSKQASIRRRWTTCWPATSYADRVRASTMEAQSIGITGIPAFALDRRLIVLGAHPNETFEQAFAQLAE